MDRGVLERCVDWIAVTVVGWDAEGERDVLRAGDGAGWCGLGVETGAAERSVAAGESGGADAEEGEKGGETQD